MISAKKALEYGLVEEVVSSEALIKHCDTLAHKLAERAPLAVGSAKLVINQCMNVDTESARNFERITQSVLKLTADHEEGSKSFIEKRKPNFSGR